MVVESVEIAGHRRIGGEQPVFVIAEAGVNHNGDRAMAERLIDVAAEAAVDAVKFQTFSADRLATVDAPKAAYQRDATDAEETQRDMLRRLELSAELHHHLVRRCAERGVAFMSSPFDEGSADLLDALGVSSYKIPSGELTNLPFLDHVARKGKPMIVSTGMATLGEVEAAVQAVERAGNHALVLLHCVSNYPADPGDVNLRAMETMRQAFGYPVGYSDHTVGSTVALAAVANGAVVIEKHFTLDRTLPGPDHRASLEPDELRELVHGIRTVERAMGSGRKVPVESEAETARVARKSLVAARDLAAGTVLEVDMVAARRPGTGLSPASLPEVVGRTLNERVEAGTLLTRTMLR